MGSRFTRWDSGGHDSGSLSPDPESRPRESTFFGMGGEFKGLGLRHRRHKGDDLRKYATLTVRRGVAQPGRALGSGPRGRRFESSRPDHHS